MLSKLDIINAMLGSIGQLPVNDPEEDNDLVTAANQILQRVLEREQAPGWWFNTEHWTLAYDAEADRIRLPDNVLSVYAPERTLVKRGQALYDTLAGDWARDASLPCRVVVALQLEDLPHQMQELVCAQAVLQFSNDFDADTAKVLAAAQNSKTARADLGAQHIRSVRANLLQTPWLQRQGAFIGRFRR